MRFRENMRSVSTSAAFVIVLEAELLFQCTGGLL